MPGKKCILLISADRHLKRTIAILLIGAGFDVTSVATCTDALKWLENHPVDLIFFDVKEEPLAFLVELHKRHPSIPLLALGRAPYSPMDAEIGKVTQLEKPVDPEIILGSVREILSAAPAALPGRKPSS